MNTTNTNYVAARNFAAEHGTETTDGRIVFSTGRRRDYEALLGIALGTAEGTINHKAMLELHRLIALDLNASKQVAA
jgi:hypothetical protein